MNLQVIGKQKIGNYEFVGIEGGFGKSKKAMTVKDISKIHNRPQGKINERIRDNMKRFKTNVDLIDLKTAIHQTDSIKYGITPKEWNASHNMFLLSERGYAKLLKILEDDVAWEVYDLLVDEYFTLRNQPRIVQPSLPQDYATALEQLAKQVRLNESLQIKVEQLSQPALVEQTELLPNVLYSTEEIAQEIGYSSARALNQRMYAERVVYYSKKDRSWLLYAPYKDRGLKDLSTRRKSQLWTEKGREFIKVRFTENK